MRPWLALSLCLGAAAPAAEPDFSEGFGQINALGLPDVRGAQWMAAEPAGKDPLDAALEQRASGFFRAPDREEDDEEEESEGDAAPAKPAAAPQGRGWVLPAAPDGSRRVVIDQTEVARVPDEAELARLRARHAEVMKRGASAKSNYEMRLVRAQVAELADGLAPVKWQSADVAKDVAAIEATVLKLRKGSENEARTLRRSSSRLILPGTTSAPKPAESLRKLEASTTRGLGLVQWFLFACNLWQQGDRAAANHLAALLLDAVDDPQAFLDEVVSSLAEGRLQEALDAVLADGDWSRYLARLEDVRTRFTRGWRAHAGMDLLVAAAKRRTAGAVPPLQLAGFNFTDEESTLYARLCDQAERHESEQPPGESEDDEQPHSALWTVAAPKDDGTPWAALQARGMKALPVLAAMLDIGLPVRLRGNSDRRGYDYFSDGENAPLSPQAAYEELARPELLSEQAEQVLRSVIPPKKDNAERGRRRSAEAERQRLREAALAFHQKHAQSSPDELARAYWTEGDATQQREALTLLLKAPAPDHEFIEKQLLAAPSLDQYELVTDYLRHRRAAGAAFLQRWREAVIAAVGTSYRPEQIDRYLQQATVFASDKSLPEMLRELGSHTHLADKTGTINTALAELPGPEAVDAVTAAVVEQSSAYIGASLLSSVLRNAKRDATFAAHLLDTPERRERWQKLLADTRPVPRPVGTTFGPTVAEAAALTLEYFAATERDPGLGLAPYLRPEDGSESHLLRRARARVAAQTVPAWEHLPEPPKDRLKALLAEAAAKPAGEIAPWFRALTPPERAVFLNAMTREKFPPSWLEANMTVQPPKVTHEPWAARFDWASLAGRKLTRADVQAIFEAVRTAPPTAAAVYLEPTTAGTGTRLEVEPVDPEAAHTFKRYAGCIRLDVTFYRGDSDSASFQTRLAATEKPGAESDENDSSSTESGDLEKALTLVEQATTSPGRPAALWIRILVLPPLPPSAVTPGVKPEEAEPDEQ